MKTVVKLNKSSKSGYSMIVTDDNGKTTSYDLTWYDGSVAEYADYLKLPANPANRQWIKESVIKKAAGEIELKYHETRSLKKAQ